MILHKVERLLFIMKFILVERLISLMIFCVKNRVLTDIDLTNGKNKMKKFYNEGGNEIKKL